MADESVLQTVKRNITPEVDTSNAAKGPGHTFDADSPQAAGEQEYKESLGSPLEVAYGKMKKFLGEHEQHLSDKVLKPFRAGLDSMAEDLQKAAETGTTKSGGQLTPTTRALVGGAGEMLKMVPVGGTVKDTAEAMITPPELKEEEALDFSKLEGHTVIEHPPSITHEPGAKTSVLRLAQGDKTHGMVKYTMGENGEAAITAANINPEMRGRGYGKKMYEQAAEQAKARGAKAITSDLAGSDSFDSGQVWESLKKKHPDEITKVPSKAGSPGYRWEFKTEKDAEPEIERERRTRTAAVRPTKFSEKDVVKEKVDATKGLKEPENKSRIVIEGVDEPKANPEGIYSDKVKIDPFAPSYKPNKQPVKTA